MTFAQFTATESAVAACLLDGMTQRQAAQAIGVGESRVQALAVRMMERFHVPRLDQLVAELQIIAQDERPFAFRQTIDGV